jgi:hypothetical protein
MVAPWIVDAPMNARRFETWIETQLVPELDTRKNRVGETGDAMIAG